MSADNAIVIRNVSNGRYTVGMEFMSSVYPEHDDESGDIFTTYVDALVFAHKWYREEAVVEYGVLDMTTDQDANDFLDMVIEENDRWTDRYYGVRRDDDDYWDDEFYYDFRDYEDDDIIPHLFVNGVPLHADDFDGEGEYV